MLSLIGCCSAIQKATGTNMIKCMKKTFLSLCAYLSSNPNSVALIKTTAMSKENIQIIVKMS